MIWAVFLSTMEFIPHRLTPELKCFAIRSLVEFGKLLAP